MSSTIGGRPSARVFHVQVHRFATALFAFVAFAWSGIAAAAPPPVDDFFRDPEIGHAELSPSGRHLAVLLGSAKDRTSLAVIDLEDGRRAKGIARFADADVVNVHWINDDRLVFGADDSREPYGRRRPYGLWAVNRDGGEFRQLIKRKWTDTISSEGNSRIARRLLEPDHYFVDTTSDGSGEVLVGQRRWNNVGDHRADLLHRLDTRTGIIRPAARAPDDRVVDWAVDLKGEARAALSQDGDRVRMYWRASGQPDWVLLDDYRTEFTPKAVPLWADGDSLYVRASYGADGAAALFRYDVDKKRMDAEPIFNVDGFDYNGAAIVDESTNRVVGLRYAADAEGTQWLTLEMQVIQKEVDALLPGRVNRVSCVRCSGAPRVLVKSFSDRQPPVYYVFDTKSRKVELIGASRPWIKAQQMAEQDFVRIKARDGRSIPVYVTKPAGKSDEARAAVVLVHGGPHARGNTWGWSAEAQFLASRGYVVVEPEFRGSEGFGYAHLSAGFKQWGLTMQDDVTDATLWAIKSAGVDPKRICIAGASYGGYAASMALVREPDLYRCGINWVGVTDPALMFSIQWSDLPEDWKRYGLRTMLGDPDQDKVRFQETSPVAQAHRIKQPMLLAYGALDRRVPLDHGTQLRDALQRNNKDVEWVVYADEGHGFYGPQNRNDFYQRVERFLAKHIGGEGTASVTAAK